MQRDEWLPNAVKLQIHGDIAARTARLPKTEIDRYTRNVLNTSPPTPSMGAEQME